MRFRGVTRIVLVALIGSLLSFAVTPAQAAYDPVTGNGTVACTTGSAHITSNVLDNGTSCVGALIVPEGVTTIGFAAFWNRGNLTSAVLPSTLTTLANFAFWTQPLPSITIPAGVTYIGTQAFADSGSLNSVNFLGSSANSALTIADGVFQGARLTSVSFPANLSNLNGTVFRGAPNLQSIYFQGDSPTLSGNIDTLLGNSPLVYYTATAKGFTAPTWGGLNVSPPQCAPTISQADSRTVLTFTNGNNASPCSWTVPANVSSVSVLVVGGGGGGGRNLGGGGGGGGLYYNENKSVTAGSSMSVAVGIGGVGSNPGGGGIAARDSANGGQSSFAEIIAPGGGAGGDLEDSKQIYSGTSGGVGASGGGGFWGFSGGSGTNSSPYRFGNSGGNGAPFPGSGAGGGGGAGGPGALGVGDTGGVGGAGKAISISGSAVFYAGGGGGSGNSAGGAGGTGGGAAGNICGVSPDPGLPNTGGGGGGYRGCGDTRGGSAGGSGVVIVSYITPLAAPAFTLTSSSETATAGSAITGYSITSTGGAVESYTVTPAIGNGLIFSTVTGLISGTPTVAASVVTYTITGTNTTNFATATYRITVSNRPNAASLPIPDPIQKSRIDSFTAVTSGQKTEIKILGSFVEEVKNIQLNGINLTLGAWIQTPTSITLTLSSLNSGSYEIQIYNGASPALKSHSFKVLDVNPPISANIKVRKALITCVKGFNQRLVYSTNPECPVGFKKK